MIQTSQKFKDIMLSRVRPQCKAFIRLYEESETEGGSDNIYTWEQKDILDFEYERSVDPLGRENSGIVFKWKERYKGKKNIYGEPTKYKNINIGCKVEIEIHQALGFRTQWEQLFNSNTSWKQLLSDGITWKKLFQNPSYESVKLPTVFLYALPTYENDVITWEARDMLSFMKTNFTYYISPVKKTANGDIIEDYIPRKISKIAKMLIDSDFEYYNTPQHLETAFENSRTNAEALFYGIKTETETIETEVTACLFEEPRCDALRKIISVYGGYYCDFNLDGSLKFNSILEEGSFYYTDLAVSRGLMYKEPVLLRPIQVNCVKTQHYDYTPNYDSPVTVKNNGWAYLGESGYTTDFKYPEYATAYDRNQNVNYSLIDSSDSDGVMGNHVWNDALTMMLLDTETDYGTIELTVYPLSNFSNEKIQSVYGMTGETYEENNNLNCIPYLSQDGSDRGNAIIDYFSVKKINDIEVPNMELTIVGIPFIETGDVCYFEGTVIDGEKVFFPELIVYHKIIYNGTIKSELKTHGMGEKQ